MNGGNDGLLKTTSVWLENISVYYISKLVRALSLVNLAGRIPLYGPLKFKAVSVCQNVSWFIEPVKYTVEI